MIRTFKDAETEKIYQRERSRKLPSDIQKVALRNLRMINNAINLNDLRVPPANRLEKLSVDARRINEIVLGKRAITADTALRLSRFFGNSPQFWLGLQTQYDLDVAEDHLGKRLDREVRPLAKTG